jgi:3-isopropylmalate/(R)-2-methylmalate dehydratase small subunit
VKAAPEDVRALMDLVERAPATHLTVDLTASLVQADGTSCVVSMPKKVRDALVTGAWDTTGLLLDRYEEVDATAARLPYIAGF